MGRPTPVGTNPDGTTRWEADPIQRDTSPDELYFTSHDDNGYGDDGSAFRQLTEERRAFLGEDYRPGDDAALPLTRQEADATRATTPKERND